MADCNSVAPERIERQWPAFARPKIDAHFDRVNNLWGGDYLVHGAKPAPDALMLLSNDYLDIRSIRSLRAAQAQALCDDDQQLVMSAVFLHGESAQQVFERQLASYLSAEDGVLCQSGW